MQVKKKRFRKKNFQSHEDNCLNKDEQRLKQKH